MCVYEYPTESLRLNDARSNPTLHLAVAPLLTPAGREDPLESSPEFITRRFVATFVGGRHDGGFVSAAEAAALPQNDVDLYIDLIRRIWIIRRSDGTILVHRKRVEGVGLKRQAYMLKVMRYAPSILPPVQWGLLDPQIDSHYHKATVTPTVACLRGKLLGEPGSEHYIIMAPSPLAYGFNEERTFRVIALNADWWHLPEID